MSTARDFILSPQVERMLNTSTGLSMEGMPVLRNAGSPLPLCLTTRPAMSAHQTSASGSPVSIVPASRASGRQNAREFRVDEDVSKMLKGRAGFSMDGVTVRAGGPKGSKSTTTTTKTKAGAKKIGSGEEPQEEEEDKLAKDQYKRDSFESSTTATTAAYSVSSKTNLVRQQDSQSSKAKMLIAKLTKK